MSRWLACYHTSHAIVVVFILYQSTELQFCWSVFLQTHSLLINFIFWLSSLISYPAHLNGLHGLVPAFVRGIKSQFILHPLKNQTMQLTLS